jgi:hypothetical protein
MDEYLSWSSLSGGYLTKHIYGARCECLPVNSSVIASIIIVTCLKFLPGKRTILAFPASKPAEKLKAKFTGTFEGVE